MICPFPLFSSVVPAHFPPLLCSLHSFHPTIPQPLTLPSAQYYHFFISLHRSRAPPSFCSTYRLTHISLWVPPATKNPGLSHLSVTPSHPPFLWLKGSEKQGRSAQPAVGLLCCVRKSATIFQQSLCIPHGLGILPINEVLCLSLWQDALLSLTLTDTRTEPLSWGSDNRISGNAFPSSVKKIIHQITVRVIQTPSDYKLEFGI